ncbi:MAG: aldo/keto reductase [Nitrospinota bacterium]|nr:aldo/keto reductase [Nitrospinota bacterium]
MEYRKLGTTDIIVSEIGFGTGGISRLMVEEDKKEQNSAITKALNNGITYFDTAAAYGSGKSENNLGRILNEESSEVIIGTKIRLLPEQLENPYKEVMQSVERSLDRLKRNHIEIIQIHNFITEDRIWPVPLSISPNDIYKNNGILEAFKELRKKNMVRYFGITGLGDPKTLDKVVSTNEFQTIQIYYNLLNPSAGLSVPQNFSAINYNLLIEKCRKLGMGIFVIRALALGALTNDTNFLKGEIPLLSLGSKYDTDVRRAGKIKTIIGENNETISQSAIRFALSNDAVSSVLIGFSRENQIDEITNCSGKPKFEEEKMRGLAKVWDSDFQ